MAFDPLSWAIGYTLTKGSTYLIGELFSKELPSKLLKVTQNWAETLPKELYVHPSAIFKYSDSDVERLPSLDKLRAKLSSKQIPEEEEWLKALIEQWQYINVNISEPQPFFQQKLEDIEKHLIDLAKAISIEIISDDRYFNIETLKRIKEIQKEQEKNTESNRNVIVTLQSVAKELGEDISNKIEKALHDVDEKVNGLFPEGVIRFNNEDIREPFNSAKIISSLGLIGIPIDISFKILRKTILKIENYSIESDSLEALKIRQFISNAIMSVETQNHSATRVQIWADSYIRRYGDPNQRIEIILYDGEVVYLEQKFVENNIIPDLIDSILKQTNYKKFKKEISNNEIKNMTREIV
jgi:hypothetical protein